MKTRLDFVSNSSASSYIITSELGPKSLGPKLFQCYRKISEKRYDWIAKAGKKLGECLANHSAITIFDITFNIPLTDEMKKQFYDSNGRSNMIYGGRCCKDSYLKSLFTRNGKIKEDIDSDSIVDLLSWYKIKDGKLYFHDDDDDIDENILVSNSGKITKQSIEFNRWLITALEKKYPEISIERKDNILEDLDNLEKQLEEYFVYYLRINHDGDGVDDDSAYYSNYGTKGDYLDTLYREGAVVDMSWMDSM